MPLIAYITYMVNTFKLINARTQYTNEITVVIFAFDAINLILNDSNLSITLYFEEGSTI